MENKNNQKRPSSPSRARFFHQLQRIFKSDEIKQLVVINNNNNSSINLQNFLFLAFTKVDCSSKWK